MRAYERLLNYVKVYTTSEDEQENVPSTSRQFDLGNQLAKELKKIGVQDVRIDDKCYVYGVDPGYRRLGRETSNRLHRPWILHLISPEKT